MLKGCSLVSQTGLKLYFIFCNLLLCILWAWLWYLNSSRLLASWREKLKMKNWNRLLKEKLNWKSRKRPRKNCLEFLEREFNLLSMGLCQTLSQKMIKTQKAKRSLSQLRKAKKISIKLNLKKKLKKKGILSKVLKTNLRKIKTKMKMI